MSKNIQNIFDIALKQSKGGCLSDGYITPDGKCYKAYYTKKEWDNHLDDIISNHETAYRAFVKGNGGELCEKRNRYGNIVPPKMASYASSSRFIYELSKNIQDYRFECKLSTSFGASKASLDGYIESKHLYVEAKCHEIYNASLSSNYNDSYKFFYNYLKEHTNGRLDYQIDKNRIHFIWNKKNLETLELKQLLCHMLGIANKALQEWDFCPKTATLVYLVYNPDDILDWIPDDVSRNSILERWRNEKKEAEGIDFKLLYNHIVHYLSTYKRDWQKNKPYSSEVDKIADAFEFRFCDQHDYIFTINGVK